MKIIGIITAAASAVCLLTGCNKAAQQEPSSIVEATPAPVPTTPAPATPAPAVATAPSQPAAPAAAPEPAAPVATPPAELAPAGVFYLVEAVRIETDAGVTGLTPGTGVKLLHDDVYLTPAGEAHLRPDQMTNDMALARQILAADRQAQAALKTTMSAQAKAVAEINAAKAAEQATTQTATLNGQDAAAKQARATQLSIQRKALKEKLDVLKSKQNGEKVRAHYDGHIIASNTVAEIKVLIDQIAAIDMELSRLQ